MTEDTSNSAGMRRKPRQARSQERVKRILDVAEELFIAEGYTATTTNAIATRAQVSIGSLYQFFPDKGAILQALALRYEELLRQQLLDLDPIKMAQLPLPVYVELIIDVTDHFFDEHPGYYAIFMQVQGTMPELDVIEAKADSELMEDMILCLFHRSAALDRTDYEAIAFVLVKTIGTLLWLALGQENVRRRRVAETKRLTLAYLQTYFPQG